MEQVQVLLPGAVATYSAKSALFTAGLADRGTFFDNTGSYTISFAAAATLGAGWSCWIRNISGTQTLDPNGTELINGATTYAVSNAGDVVLVECTGTAFVISHSQRPATVAITGGTINNTTIGASTATTGRFTTVESTIATGTAPFIIASTTVVPNLNVSQLLGGTWAIPGAIGATTPNAGAFTTGSFTDAVTLTTASSGLTIGKTTGTTLVVSSTAATCATFGGGATFGGAITVAGSSTFTVSNASTTSSDTVITFRHSTSGTAAAGFGSRFHFQLDSSTTANQDGASILASWADATHATRKGRVRIHAWDATDERECLRCESNGSAGMIGFLGTGASVRTAITGSRAGNAALASLLTELATKGLITDSTSA